MIKKEDGIIIADIKGLKELPTLGYNPEYGDLKIIVKGEEQIYIDIKNKIVNYLMYTNHCFWDKIEYTFDEWDYMNKVNKEA